MHPLPAASVIQRRKYADRTRWVQVIKRQFEVIHLHDASYHGYITITRFNALKTAYKQTVASRELTVADTGYTWLQHFPHNQPYCQTSMFNARGEWQLIYIDIAATTGLSDENIPFWDDLYLDILLSPNTPPQLVDHDDLNQGLQQGVITQQHAYDAHTQAHALIQQINHHNYDLIALCQTHFKQFINE